MNYEFIAPCHFGLEAAAKQEIAGLGYEISEVTDGKVCFYGNEAAICRANIFLRTVERILIKCGDFEAFTWDELFNKVYGIAWEKYIPADGYFYVAKANSIKSKLFSPRDFQTIIQKAIVKRLSEVYGIRGRMSMSGEEYPLRVSVLKNRTVIGLDTSGESLHKRGYRKLSAAAPITETLAAALLGLTPWKQRRILVDPFCGSGTFPIEAAMMALDIAPGMDRNFISTSWGNITEKKLWYSAYDEARKKAGDVDRDLIKEETDIQGYDIDNEVIEAARKNADAAGVADIIHFQKKDIAMLSHRKKYGIIITNPPYGERIMEKEDISGLYVKLGERYSGMNFWDLYYISAFENSLEYVKKGIKSTEDIKIDIKNRKVYNGMMKTYFYSIKQQEKR